jgi:hypothetical protein
MVARLSFPETLRSLWRLAQPDTRVISILSTKNTPADSGAARAAVAENLTPPDLR